MKWIFDLFIKIEKYLNTKNMMFFIFGFVMNQMNNIDLVDFLWYNYLMYINL